MEIRSTLAAVIFLMMSSAHAAGVTKLPAINMELKISNGLDRIEEVLVNPEQLLIRYKPAGAVITKKSVDRNQFQFFAKKTVMFYTQNVFIHSYFSVIQNTECVSKTENGFLIRMDFAGSDKLITDNVEKFEAQICVQEFPDKLGLKINSRIYKGNDYSSIVGPIVSDMIAAQNGAFIEAFSAEVKTR